MSLEGNSCLVAKISQYILGAFGGGGAEFHSPIPAVQFFLRGWNVVVLAMPHNLTLLPESSACITAIVDSLCFCSLCG